MKFLKKVLAAVACVCVLATSVTLTSHAAGGRISFADPDTPGEHIRRLIGSSVPGCKHAFINKEKAKTPKKVGVEHASKEDLWDALCHYVTFENKEEVLSWQDFIDLGLVGNKNLRFQVCEDFHIGPCNAKTCFKRLNQMNVTKEEIEERSLS